MLQWISATIAVLALILLMARGLRWMLDRSRRGGGPVSQVGAWRVAPDASVRAVRTFGRVHLLYERGRESVLLESVDTAEFDGRAQIPVSGASPSSPAPRVPREAARARVARA